jgi:hypothetical protein
MLANIQNKKFQNHNNLLPGFMTYVLSNRRDNPQSTKIMKKHKCLKVLSSIKWLSCLINLHYSPTNLEDLLSQET